MAKKTSSVCTIYLVRHGVTDFNIQKKLQGHLDIPLNELGKKQAVELAKSLEHVHFDAVYSSDLIRARATAEAISQVRKLEVHVTQALRERNFGKAEGRSRIEDREVKNALESFLGISPDEQWKFRPIEGWETNEELLGRTFTYLRALALEHLGETVLIVTHGSVIITLLAHLGFITREQVGFGVLGNGAYVELQSDGIDFTVKRTEGLNLSSKK